jgi:hypothetical protein
MSSSKRPIILSDTIYKYQKGKHVMATPSQLVLRSDLDFDAGKREAVLGTWNEQTGGQKVNVRLNSEVKAISRRQGRFHPDADRRHRDQGRSRNHGDRHPGQSEPAPAARRRSAPCSISSSMIPANMSTNISSSSDRAMPGIENALGLAADPEQRNIVTILNRTADFSRAKDANVKLLFAARDAGRMTVMPETAPTMVEIGFVTLDTRDGEVKIPCDRIIARMGSACPAQVHRGMRDRSSAAPIARLFPSLSPAFESTKPGIYVIGALAGYPLIKHCMNQGYDVVEFINGNTTLKPADEPILEAKFAGASAESARSTNGSNICAPMSRY